MKVAVVMPVGPGDEERARAERTLRELARREPAIVCAVLVDDNASPRTFDVPRVDRVRVQILPSATPPSAERHWRVSANTLSAIAWIWRNADADVLMKIDTDAAVVAPFADRLAEAFDAHPEVGMFGSYDRKCNGDPRDFDPVARLCQIAARRLQLRVPRPRLAMGRAAKLRKLILQARARGYQWGEHCLGAAFALRVDVVQIWGTSGLLDDPHLFRGSYLYDDPALGILTRWAGASLSNLVEPGDPFALAWRGLPLSLEEIASGGYAIIHSVKNDPRWNEDEIRGYFQ